MTQVATPTTRKDWTSDQEVRWCPGCGDYSILAALQMLMPELGVRRESTVFVSGIGCAARFPYYMNTYGLHSIHGRAPALATGLAVTRPDLDVWVIGGDGDMLSIGGNHLIHALRRNVNLTILMFNNRIYGLTKGQYSPTSESGKVTKSTPLGSIDAPFNPISVALGAEATFVARTHDMDRAHMQETFRRAHEHRGASFVEVFQNCNVFNDGTFEELTSSRPARRHAHLARRRRADPLRRGPRARRRAARPTARVELVDVADVGEDALLVHDEAREDPGVAFALSRLGDSAPHARRRSGCSAPSSAPSWARRCPPRSWPPRSPRGVATWPRSTARTAPGRLTDAAAPAAADDAGPQPDPHVAERGHGRAPRAASRSTSGSCSPPPTSSPRGCCSARSGPPTGSTATWRAACTR